MGTSSDVDWPRLAFEAMVSLLSAIGGLIVGAWRWGRDYARAEQKVRDDVNQRMETLAKETQVAMTALERANEARINMMVEQFKETLQDVHRQIGDQILVRERDFVRKDEFWQFREEWRADMRDLKAEIGRIARQ